jgi:integrase
MKTTFRLVRRGKHYYAHSRITGQRESLKTSDSDSAQRLLDAMNEAERFPTMNLALGRVFLAARDAALPSRTWGDVMERIGKEGRVSTQARYARAMNDPHIGRLKNRRLIETTSEDLFAIMAAGTKSTTYYLKRVHHFALGLGFLPAPILPPKLWPKVKWGSRRAITLEEHERLIGDDPNEERKAYYELLWLTGASQGDAANLTVENIDWKDRTLTYQRAKLQENAPPACTSIGSKLEALLRVLPSSGLLFPQRAAMNSQVRSDEFSKRSSRAGIRGVSLHSYRYAWAERAYASGMPERFAMAVLGHSSEIVHRLYARKAKVLVPALEAYEEQRMKVT